LHDLLWLDYAVRIALELFADLVVIVNVIRKIG